MLDVICFGAATVDIVVKSDQLVIINNFLSIPCSSKSEISKGLICSGGGATNSSASFASLGLKSACVSLLGNDPISGYVLNDLKDFSVNISLLNRPKNESTDYSIVLVGPDGSRSILTNRGQSRLEVKDISWSKIKNTKWFYITSLEGNIELLEQLIGFAVENKIKIALNPGRRELKHISRLKQLLSHIDFFLLNETEAQIFTGLESNESKFWDMLAVSGPKIISITKGREGAHVLIKNKNYFSPIINVKPVDELGAGDAFGSAFVAGLVHGLEPPDALFWGIKNSASVVSKLGAKAGLLTLKQINL